jgi:hypothetical protein
VVCLSLLELLAHLQLHHVPQGERPVKTIHFMEDLNKGKELQRLRKPANVMLSKKKYLPYKIRNAKKIKVKRGQSYVNSPKKTLNPRLKGKKVLRVNLRLEM